MIPNYMQFYNYDLITQTFYDEYDIDPNFIMYLDEIFVCSVSVMIFKKDNQTVLEAIELALKLCEKFEMKETISKLQLIRLSVEMKKMKTVQYEYEQIINEIDQSFSNNQLGQAELFYI